MGSKEIVDPKIIAKARVGDHTAFESIYEHYWNPIYNFVYRMIGNPQDAYDFTQETFLRAYKAFPRTSPDLSVGAWIYRIATNACLDELRHRKLIKWQPLYAQSENLSDPNYFIDYIPSRSNNEPLPIISTDRAYNPEEALLDKEDIEEIGAILDRLNPKYRLCLILFHYQELSYDEIAEVLNTNRNCVRSLLYRAREEFRQVYARTNRKPNLQPSWSWVYH